MSFLKNTLDQPDILPKEYERDLTLSWMHSNFHSESY